MQAFGGGEHWFREPTAREVRAMNYLSMVSGARGLYYFIEGFPAARSMWAECRSMGLETAGIG